MMGMRMPETCWAVFKWQVINMRSCCILFFDSVESSIMHGLAKPKFQTLNCNLIYSGIQKIKQANTSEFCVSFLFTLRKERIKYPKFTISFMLITVWYRNVNKNVQRDATICRHLFTVKVTLHISGVTAPIIRSTKLCNLYLWYRSYCKIQIKN